MFDVLESDTVPLDYYLVPAGNSIYDHACKDAQKTVEIAREVTIKKGEHFQWMPKAIKLFADGAVFSQLMQLKDGYFEPYAYGLHRTDVTVVQGTGNEDRYSLDAATWLSPGDFFRRYTGKIYP